MVTNSTSTYIHSYLLCTSHDLDGRSVCFINGTFGIYKYRAPLPTIPALLSNTIDRTCQPTLFTSTVSLLSQKLSHLLYPAPQSYTTTKLINPVEVIYPRGCSKYLACALSPAKIASGAYGRIRLCGARCPSPQIVKQESNQGSRDYTDLSLSLSRDLQENSIL